MYTTKTRRKSALLFAAWLSIFVVVFGITIVNFPSLFFYWYIFVDDVTNTNSNMAGNTNWTDAKSVYDFNVNDLDGNVVSLEKYRGHPLIIVNVASKCGFTKRDYQQLNELHSKYKDQGLRILGFPCNQFMNQEPDCSVDIKEFIKKNNVEWDIFEKINVNGDEAHPLYNYLKSKQG